jgi:DNA-binding MarR family transcriptional regulator
MTSDPNTIASLVSRMERLHLLTRRPDPTDRRARRLQLTHFGRKRFEELRQIAQELQTEMLAGLPASTRLRFLDQLEQVANACRNAAES